MFKDRKCKILGSLSKMRVAHQIRDDRVVLEKSVHAFLDDHGVEITPNIETELGNFSGYKLAGVLMRGSTDFPAASTGARKKTLRDVLPEADEAQIKKVLAHNRKGKRRRVERDSLGLM